MAATKHKHTKSAPLIQEPRAPIDPHERSHYQRSTDAHWFVSSAFNWRAGLQLSTVLKELRAADKSAFPHAKGPMPCAIYRVPGPATREYQIRNYGPYGVDALFCGFDDLTSKGMD